MGFIIKQPLETNQGLLEEAYARIEMYRVDMFNGLLHTTIAMYPSRQAALDTFPVYFGERNASLSQVVGVAIVHNGVEMTYPTYFEFPLVEDIQAEVPLFEEVSETKTSTYYDFDADGNIVEKTREDITTKVVQTGTQLVTKQKIKIDQGNGNIYSHAYSLVKAEFSKIFGDENIVDD
jgi:hypothetical protein